MHHSYYKIVFAVLFLIVSLLHTSNIFAASIELSEPNISAVTNVDQEYQVKVKLSINSPDGTVYFLRGVFYKADTRNYCGYTWNGSSWFNGPFTSNEGWKNLPSVSISSDSAEAELKTKIDSADSGCKDSGDYKFKVERFTGKGSGTFDSQNELTLNFNFPTLTAVPTPVSPSATAKPTKVPASVTPVPKTENKIISGPSKLNQTLTNPSIADTGFYISGVITRGAVQSSQGAVMGESENQLIEAITVQTSKSKRQFDPAPVLIFSGGLCLIGAAVMSLKIIKRQRRK